MESQPQNHELPINPENFHPCMLKKVPGSRGKYDILEY